ncbi:MAG: hypothetical protein ACKV0T_25135 [Planctomycetales bacterium]
MGMLVGAVCAGLLLGGLVSAIWQGITLRLGKSDFWTSFRRLTGELVTGNEDQFLQQYGQLLKLLGGYLGRNALTLCLSFLPVVLTVLFAAPAAMDRYNLQARWLEVHVAESVELRIGGQVLTSEGEPARFTPVPGEDGAGTVTLSTGELAFDSWLHNQAFSTSGAKCLGLELLGFHAHHVEQGPELLIVRASRGDANFFWPYLNDAEFAFYLALSLASAIGMVILKRKRG